MLKSINTHGAKMVETENQKRKVGLTFATLVIGQIHGEAVCRGVLVDVSQWETGG